MSRIYVCISSVVCLSVCLYVFVYADVTDMQARYPLVGFTGLDLGWVEGTVLSVLRVMSYRASYPTAASSSARSRGCCFASRGSPPMLLERVLLQH